MRKKMLILSFLTLGMIGIFILVGLNGFDEYALKSRFLQIAAIIIVAICIAVSTVIFQTLCNNKILTPAIIGLVLYICCFKVLLSFLLVRLI